MRCGLTLRELGRHAGRMGVQAVAKACGRMGEKLKVDKKLQRQLARVRRVLKGGEKDGCTMYNYDPITRTLNDDRNVNFWWYAVRLKAVRSDDQTFDLTKR